MVPKGALQGPAGPQTFAYFAYKGIQPWNLGRTALEKPIKSREVYLFDSVWECDFLHFPLDQLDSPI